MAAQPQKTPPLFDPASGWHFLPTCELGNCEALAGALVSNPLSILRLLVLAKEDSTADVGHIASELGLTSEQKHQLSLLVALPQSGLSFDEKEGVISVETSRFDLASSLGFRIPPTPAAAALLVMVVRTGPLGLVVCPWEKQRELFNLQLTLSAPILQFSQLSPHHLLRVLVSALPTSQMLSLEQSTDGTIHHSCKHFPPGGRCAVAAMLITGIPHVVADATTIQPFTVDVASSSLYIPFKRLVPTIRTHIAKKMSIPDLPRQPAILYQLLVKGTIPTSQIQLELPTPPPTQTKFNDAPEFVSFIQSHLKSAPMLSFSHLMQLAHFTRVSATRLPTRLQRFIEDSSDLAVTYVDEIGYVSKTDSQHPKMPTLCPVDRDQIDYAVCAHRNGLVHGAALRAQILHRVVLRLFSDSDNDDMTPRKVLFSLSQAEFGQLMGLRVPAPVTDAIREHIYSLFTAPVHGNRFHPRALFSNAWDIVSALGLLHHTSRHQLVYAPANPMFVVPVDVHSADVSQTVASYWHCVCHAVQNGAAVCKGLRMAADWRTGAPGPASDAGFSFELHAAVQNVQAELEHKKRQGMSKAVWSVVPRADGEPELAPEIVSVDADISFVHKTPSRRRRVVKEEPDLSDDDLVAENPPPRRRRARIPKKTPVKRFHRAMEEEEEEEEEEFTVEETPPRKRPARSALKRKTTTRGGKSTIPYMCHELRDLLPDNTTLLQPPLPLTAIFAAHCTTLFSSYVTATDW